MKFWLSLHYLAVLCVCLTHQDCGKDVRIGPDTTERAITEVDTTERFFIALDSGFIDCYGVLKKWSMYKASDFDSCHDVIFQIWRQSPTQDGFYLAAEFPYLINDEDCFNIQGGVLDLELPEKHHTPVQPGDIIGWYENFNANNISERMIPYDQWEQSASLQYGRVRIVENCDTHLGNVCEWPRKQTEVVRAYSVQTEVNGTSQAPTWLNLNLLSDPDDEEVEVIMDEHLPPGHIVYHAHSFYNFTANKVVPPQLTYTFESCTCDCNLFEINDEGLIVTTQSLKITHQCELGIVASHGSAQSDIGLLQIKILDINEPHRLESGLPATVTLNTRGDLPDNPIHTITVSDDDDLDKTSSLTYLVTQADPLFPSPPLLLRASDDSRSLEINWDANSIFANRIHPQSLQIWITVTDSEEFSIGPHVFSVHFENLRKIPMISNLPNVISLPETHEGPQEIFQVELTENDPRSEVEYNIVKIQPSKGWKYFDIDQDTGIISTTDPDFNFFEDRNYIISIIATDDMFSSEVKTLSISISWVNSPPFILGGTIIKAEIDELQPIGTQIPGVTLEGTDRDFANGDWIQYIIKESDDAYLFSAKNDTHTIHLQARENFPKNTDSITIECIVIIVDSYSEQSNDEIKVDITFNDINDHPPIFQSNFYNGSVGECDMGGTWAGVTVKAYDDDGSKYGAITYSIEEDIANLYFEVDAADGHIWTKQPINHTLYPSFSFTVLATDGGSPPLQDITSVVIDINECNSHRPFFSPPFYDIEVRSDTPIHSHVLTLTSTDYDSDDVQNLEFYPLAIHDQFDVHPILGEVTTIESLKPSKDYHLYFNVRDNGVPAEFRSDPGIARVTSYDPEKVLVDITLKMPLQDFLMVEDRFVELLDKDFHPWHFKIECRRSHYDRTVVSIYALESNETEIDPHSSVHEIRHTLTVRKIFVGKDKLLKKLQSNFFGWPVIELLSANFAPHQPINVEASFKNWWLETVEGIAVICVICLTVLVAIILAWCLAKKKKWLCFSETKVEPVTKRESTQYSDQELYKLNYGAIIKPRNTTDQYNAYATGPLLPQYPKNDLSITFGKPPRKEEQDEKI